jgi:hypothetical protein
MVVIALLLWLVVRKLIIKQYHILSGLVCLFLYFNLTNGGTELDLTC